jgi:opacity protein-like surface antigen
MASGDNIIFLFLGVTCEIQSATLDGSDIELHEGGEMLKVSMFVGLALFALAGSVRAQESAPPPAADAPVTAPAGDTAAAPAPEAAAAPAAAAAASDSKIQVGINFLPMVLGKLTSPDLTTGESATVDAKLAYGVGITAGYNVIPGLSVGIAPQFIFNVKGKDASGDASKEYDLMLRVAYAYTVAPKFSVLAEVLPGYSIISVPSAWGIDKPKGLVLAGGLGAMYDVTDQLFVNVGVGYQMGFQKVSVAGSDYDVKVKFLRIALGVGMKL